MRVNVLIVTRNGLFDNPIVVEDDVTAQAVFDNLVDSLVTKDERDEINLHTDSQLDDLNYLINPFGISVEWFTDIEVNRYKN